MIQYIYFVKCPNCEDEPFDFFDEAKEFALGCLSNKPVITQIEINRNDFGECTDSADLGTVWSWEDMMADTEKETTDRPSLLTRDFLKATGTDNDQEFDTLDNSVDVATEDDDFFVINAEEDFVKEDFNEHTFQKTHSYSDIDTISKSDLYDRLVVKNEIVEINVGETDGYTAIFSDGSIYSDSDLELKFDPETSLFSVYEWYNSNDGDRTDGDYEFATTSFDELWCELEPFISGRTIEEPKKAISENAARDGGFRTKGYRTALACYDSDDFDINVELGLLDEDDYEVKDQVYLLKPGQTVADLVVYLSHKCGFTNVYVYGETVATRQEMQTATKFDTVPGAHDYRHYGTIENRIVEQHTSSARKPIPEGMTIEQLVEEMEENEDIVECKWCEELYDKIDCRYEVDMGWLCEQCIDAIKSRGEQLHFIDEPLVEAIADDTVELQYDELTVRLDGEQRDADDIDEIEYTDAYVYSVDRDEVIKAIWDFVDEEDTQDVPGGLDVLVDNDKMREEFLEANFNKLFNKYYQELLDYFEDDATEAFSKAYDDYQYDVRSRWFDEGFSTNKKPSDRVNLEYDNLTITLQSDKYDADDWDEVEYSDSYTFSVDKEDVATAIWENFITEADVVDVPGGLEALEDETTWEKFLETHFDILFEKYYNKLLYYFEEAAVEAFEDEYSWDDYVADRVAERSDRDFDRWREERFFDESFTANKSMLEELEEPDAYRNRLITCPECDTNSFDPETGMCINCGFN